MDQNLTPRGGPAPKKAHFAARVLQDSNIEPTLLVDQANVSAELSTYSRASTTRKSPPVLSTIVEGSQNELDDSLAELTCQIPLPSLATTGILKSRVDEAIVSSRLSEVPTSPVVETKPEVQLKDEQKVNAEMEVEVPVVAEEQPVLDTSVFPFSEVDFVSSIFEALKLEIDTPPADRMNELNEQVAALEFLAAEHLAGIMTKQKPKGEEGAVGAAVTKALRLIIGIVKESAQKSGEIEKEKLQVEFKSMIDAEKATAADDRQLLERQVEELKAALQENQERSDELVRENKRLNELAAEADHFESQLLKFKAEIQMMRAKN